jgi:hypothetical protein
MRLTQLFAKFVASIMVLLVGGMALGTGGATMNSLRHFDVRMGWLQPASESLEHTYRKIFTVESEAFFGGGAAPSCIGPCLSESAFQIEKAFERLLKNIVMSFVQGLISFLKEQFLNILNQIEQWAETVFGLRLNLCYVKRFVSYQSALLYNSIEGQINKTIFRGTVDSFEGDSAAQNTMNQVFADAGAAVDFAAAAEVADRENPGCAAADKLPSSRELISSIGDSVADMEEAAGELREAALGNDGITDVVYESLNINNALSPSTPAENAAESALTQRANEVQVNAEEAVEQAQAETPADCPANMYIAPKSENQGNPNFGNFGNTVFEGTKMGAAADVVSNFVAQPLTATECSAADQTTAAQNALETSAAAGSGAPEGESIVDTIFSVIQDFFNQIFEQLKDIITNLIQKAINAITSAINQFAGNFTGSVFGEFGGFVDNIAGEFDRIGDEITAEINNLEAPDITS